MPSKARNSRPLTSHSGRRKSPNSKPALYFVTLPTSVISERSMFATYSPGKKTHRTAFSNEFVIEGTGEVHIRVFASGKSITLSIKDCWHVPNSPHNLLSTLSGCLRGNQYIIASRTPRMIFPHKSRILQPNSPKYLPFTREDGFLVLRFQLLAPIAPASQSNPPPPPQSFAGLSSYPFSFLPPSVPSISSLNQLSLLELTSPFTLPEPNFHTPFSNPLSVLPVSRIDASPAPPFNSHPIQLPTSPAILDNLDWPFCSLTYPQFNSHPLPFSPLDPPLEVPVSLISYPIPNFKPQSINPSHVNNFPPTINTSACPSPLTRSPQYLQHSLFDSPTAPCPSLGSLLYCASNPRTVPMSPITSSASITSSSSQFQSTVLTPGTCSQTPSRTVTPSHIPASSKFLRSVSPSVGKQMEDS